VLLKQLHGQLAEGLLDLRAAGALLDAKNFVIPPCPVVSTVNRQPACLRCWRPAPPEERPKAGARCASSSSETGKPATASVIGLFIDFGVPKRGCLVASS
jgi:hypothetical protein